MASDMMNDLLSLSHEIGREDRDLAMLGEGNTSCRIADDAFLVKASGTCLGTLRETDVVECRLSAVTPLLDREGLSDTQVDEALLAARTDKSGKKPSVETMFHGFLLTLPGVRFVAHAHPTAVNQILCSPKAKSFAENRMFPDEIVCCGGSSVFVPLTDPGLRLARTIRGEVKTFIDSFGQTPRVILMQNHGVVTLGATWQAALAAMLMVDKAARVFVGATLLGGPRFLTAAEVNRIAGRPDELYRQRVLAI